MIKPTGDNDGYYYIIARSNGLALDLTNAKDQDGANVAVHAQNQTVAQKWKLRRVLKDDMVKVNDVMVRSETDGIVPEITVTVDDTVLEADTDYTVTVTTDITTSKGTVTVTGVDNYCDSVTKEFNISVAPAILGDADGDGSPTITDATWIQRALAYMDVTTAYDEVAADVDGDGGVTITDATWIQRWLARMDTPYAIGEAIR